MHKIFADPLVINDDTDQPGTRNMDKREKFILDLGWQRGFAVGCTVCMGLLLFSMVLDRLL